MAPSWSRLDGVSATVKVDNLCGTKLLRESVCVCVCVYVCVCACVAVAMQAVVVSQDFIK